MAAMLVGVIQSDLGLLAAAVSLLLGGIVVWGSNSSTAKEATKELAAAEIRARSADRTDQSARHFIAEYVHRSARVSDDGRVRSNRARHGMEMMDYMFVAGVANFNARKSRSKR